MPGVLLAVASTIESTNVDIADDPAHSDSRKPTEMISGRPRPRTSPTVGWMIWSTTFSLNTVWLNVMIFDWMISTVLGPNQPPT